MGLVRDGRPDATDAIDALMRRKSPPELDAMRRAAALADNGYKVFMQAARIGRHEYELVADVEAWFREHGCADNFMIMGSGGQEVRGMRPPNDRRLRRGDLVTTELTPAVNGYYAQICRTLVIGAASAEQKAAFAVWREALEAGIAAVKPGARAADVARAENDVFRRHGLGDYVTSEYTRVRGHGMGLFPDATPAILEDVTTVLEPDMTIIVHPNTYHPVVGYLVLGDAVRVTETGCEVLCRTPRELFVVPG
jgi:Xaa-Pro aminopeptidase